MPISTIQLCNRIGRRARGGDFTKLSLNEQNDLIEAANTALQRLYNALPTYFKEQTQGFVLPAPLNITGVNVTQYSKTVTGMDATEAQFGQTVVLSGDSQWNQIIGANELLNPYMGTTGVASGTIYGNAIHSDTYPLDRIIGDPMFANQSQAGLYPMSMSVNSAQQVDWVYQQNIGIPAVWWAQVFGNSQGNKPIMVLRFAPAPEQAYAINVRIGFWPKRITLADYAANTDLPVPDQFIEPSLIKMCLQEFTASPAFIPRNPDDTDQVIQRGMDGEKFAKLQLGQIGSPQNLCGTPIGY
jgi:hypothetical protein